MLPRRGCFYRNQFLSKLISDLINEFHSVDEIECEIDGDFELFIMSIKIDEFGEYDSSESILPISYIEVDSEKEECLFHFGSSDTMTIASTVEKIKAIDSNYLLCSAEEKTIDNALVRIDNPIIGFGENIEQKRFFLVFQTYECH